jgi:hypothetical protein
MKLCWPVTAITLAMLALASCSEDAVAPEPEPLEIEGSWLYLGPSDGPHTLTIRRTAMLYADVNGTWSSNWTIKGHDNGLHHFQVAFDSGSGVYLPVGQSMSGTYDVSGTFLTVQLANGASYPQLQGPGTCTATAGGAPVPDCRLYVKQ